MSYYGNYAILIEKQRQEDNEKKKKQLIDKIRKQQEEFRRRLEGYRRRRKRVFRGPGKNVTKEEANEYMTLMKEYYAKKALREEKKRGEEFKLPKSAHTFQKEKSQKKFGKSKTKKLNKKSPNYKLTATKLRINRKKQKPIDAESKILTNKNNYRMSLRGTKKNYFGGRKRKRKTKKCKRKRKTKKRRK